MGHFRSFLCNVLGGHLLEFWLDCEQFKDTMEEYDEEETVLIRTRLFRYSSPSPSQKGRCGNIPCACNRYREIISWVNMLCFDLSYIHFHREKKILTVGWANDHKFEK